MLNIPIFDLDKVFWDSNSDSYGVRTPDDIRNNKLQEILQNEKWIIEGVYYSWLFSSFTQADIIIVLKPNPFLRTWRIVKRFIKRKLKLAQTNKESINDLMQLITWNHKYDCHNLRKALEFIQEFDNKIIYTNGADKAISLIKNDYVT